MVVNRKCPVCRSDVKEVLYTLNFGLEEDFPLPEKNEIVCCKKCGFVFADNNATQNDYDLYYSKFNDYSESMDVKSQSNKSYKIMLDVIKKYFNCSDSVIDIGCGSGELLKLMKNEGYTDLTALDPSEVSIKQLRNIGIKGKVQSIFDKCSEIDSSSYDVILSTSVAEHIFDLNGYINCLKQYLSSDGCIFIMVPDVLDFKSHKYDLSNYFNQEHINYFSMISLDNIMMQLGMKQVCDYSDRYAYDINGERMLFGIYCVTQEERNIVFDYESQKSVSALLSDSINSFDVLDELGEEEFILWGTGSLATRLIGEYPEIVDRIAFCVDNNKMKTGRSFSGKQVFSPDYLIDNSDKYPILICSIMNSDAIKQQIKAMNLLNKVVVLEKKIF